VHILHIVLLQHNYKNAGNRPMRLTAGTSLSAPMWGLLNTMPRRPGHGLHDVERRPTASYLTPLPRTTSFHMPVTHGSLQHASPACT